jgi:hypothetical protein
MNIFRSYASIYTYGNSLLTLYNCDTEFSRTKKNLHVYIKNNIFTCNLCTTAYLLAAEKWLFRYVHSVFKWTISAPTHQPIKWDSVDPIELSVHSFFHLQLKMNIQISVVLLLMYCGLSHAGRRLSSHNSLQCIGRITSSTSSFVLLTIVNDTKRFDVPSNIAVALIPDRRAFVSFRLWVELGFLSHTPIISHKNTQGVLRSEGRYISSYLN